MSQADVMKFLEQNGGIATLDEISAAIGVNKRSVYDNLQTLTIHGEVSRVDKKRWRLCICQDTIAVQVVMK